MMIPILLRAGARIEMTRIAEIPGLIYVPPYIVKVHVAGGWKKYEQQHLARLPALLPPTPRLPPEMVRKILEFWLHAGYY